MATASASHPVSKRSLYFLDIVGENNQRLAPMHGYQDKPIAPLDRAVAPIISFVPDVEKMVACVKKGIDKPLKNLSLDETRSLTLYTMEWEPRENSFFYVFNQTLRTKNRDSLKPWFLLLKLIMTALEKLPSISSKVYRGVKGDLSDQYSVGMTFTWWGFSSCTSDKKVLEEDQFLGTTGKRTVFVIRCKSGKDIHKLSFYENEFEVLLLPETRLRVIKCSKSSDLTTIELEEIQSELVVEPEPDYALRIPPPSLSCMGHSNPILEDLINEKNSGTAIVLNNRALSDLDMWIVVEQALNRKQCSELSLAGNRRISDHGISIIALALQTNKTLHTLCLSHNRHFTSKCAKVLAEGLHRNVSLRVLDLSNNNIGDEGADHLAEMLKVNQTVRDLDLADNQIRNQGVERIALVLQQSNTALERLSLNYNPIADGCVDSLIEMLQSNKKLKQLEILSTVTLSPKAKARLSQADQTRVT